MLLNSVRKILIHHFSVDNGNALRFISSSSCFHTSDNPKSLSTISEGVHAVLIFSGTFCSCFFYPFWNASDLPLTIILMVSIDLFISPNHKVSFIKDSFRYNCFYCLLFSGVVKPIFVSFCFWRDKFNQKSEKSKTHWFLPALLLVQVLLLSFL